MLDILRTSTGPECETGGVQRQVASPSPLDTLRRTKLGLESKLADVNEAIAALEANPDIEKVLTVLGKAIRY